MTINSAWPSAVQVGRTELHALDRRVHVLLGFDAQVGLLEQPHPALRQEGQVRTAVAVEVAGGHRRAAVRRQHGLVALAQAGRRSEVDVGVHAAGVAALLVADDQVRVAVAADVGHGRRGAAAGRQLGALAGTEHVPIHAGRGRLQVDLRVAEQQVRVAVAVEVQMMDALQHPGPRHVEILARIAEGAAPKRLESACDPTAVHLDNGRTLPHSRNVKQKVGTLLEEDLVKEVRRVAAEDGRRISDVISDALIGYLAERRPDRQRADAGVPRVL